MMAVANNEPNNLQTLFSYLTINKLKGEYSVNKQRVLHTRILSDTANNKGRGYSFTRSTRRRTTPYNTWKKIGQ
jgi:hypothetical protein